MAKLVDLERARETTVAEAAQYFKRNQKKLKVHVRQGPIKSVRTEKHRGREIKLTATYDIRIGGQRLGHSVSAASAVGHAFGNCGRLVLQGRFGGGSGIGLNPAFGARLSRRL